MLVNKPIRLLHIAYWTGAAADFIVAIGMIFPGILKRAYALDTFIPDPSFTFAMRFGAALMLGWTALLIWADRKPVERRGVLILTVFVIIGLMLSTLYAVISGFVPVREMILTWIFQVLLVVLFSMSYFSAKPETLSDP